jgi:hypothetical protein
MTAADNAIAFKPADAPSQEAYSWHATNWRKAIRNVRRLQARIVKAAHRCVLQWAFEMLERLAGKLARAVLRGGGGGNVTSLPDSNAPAGPFKKCSSSYADAGWSSIAA